MPTEPLSHCQLVDFMNRSLDLQKRIIAKVRSDPEELADQAALEAYLQYASMLEEYRNYDYYMKRDRWEWIWKREEAYSYKDLYYRLSWINREIVCIL